VDMSPISLHTIRGSLLRMNDQYTLLHRPRYIFIVLQ